ncbi:MAG: universal stress protein [Motiliproteus sp.]
MFSKILLPVDMDELSFSYQALDLALKGSREAGTELHLVTVIPDNGTPVVAACFQQAAVRKATREAQCQLDDYAQQYLPAGCQATLTVLSGHPAGQLLGHARIIDADLIIMAAHNRSRVDEALLGSTTSKLVDKARCSVVVLRKEASATPMGQAVSAG